MYYLYARLTWYFMMSPRRLPLRKQQSVVDSNLTEDNTLCDSPIVVLSLSVLDIRFRHRKHIPNSALETWFLYLSKRSCQKRIKNTKKKIVGRYYIKASNAWLRYRRNKGHLQIKSQVYVYNTATLSNNVC